ncbi:hypothetical protein FRC12_009315 [Ceratobasidium sp. 428]|nr:hypothetical protein FRC12_009315 [Ceratobasidium sp. 428]
MLPEELFYRITTFMPVGSTADEEWNLPDLARLVLVNKRFNRIFTPLLYKYVTLNSYEQLAIYHCNASAISNSRFTICLTIACKALLKHRTPPYGKTWLDILSPLAEMQNLRKLVIHRSGGMCNDTNIEHPALVYLAMQATNPAFLPNLSILKVPHHPQLFTLCRGRPVTTVDLGPNVAPVLSEEFGGYVLELTKGTRRLEELTLYWPPGNRGELLFVENVSRVIGLCSELRVLEMRLPKSFMTFMGWDANTFEVRSLFYRILSKSYIFVQSIFIPWAQATLAPLSQLTHLNLHISQPTAIPMSMQEHAIQALGRILPNLVHTILPVSQCEWSRKPGCDAFAGWSPRPNLGYTSIDWWLDFLGQDGAAHVEYVYPRTPSKSLDKRPGRAAFCEDVARTISSMRERWGEEHVPLSSEVEGMLSARAGRAKYMSGGEWQYYDPDGY